MNSQQHGEDVGRALNRNDEDRLTAAIDNKLDEIGMFDTEVESIRRREQATQFTVSRLVARLHSKGVLDRGDVIHVLGL